jgi:hypothetical protein
MTQINPNPIASPVSTYARGEFREPTPSNAGETIAALSQFNKSLIAFSAIRANKMKMRDEDAAKEWHLKNRMSMDAFKTAINEGTLPQGESPWFQDHLSKLVAADHARDIALDIDKRWREAKMSQATDEQALTWFDEQTRGAADGLDSSTASELYDSIGRIRTQFVVSHHQRAVSERESEAHYQMGVRLVSMIESSVDAMEPGTELSSNIADTEAVNLAIDNALQSGMTPDQLRQLAVSAAASVAARKQDPSLYREILQSTRVGNSIVGLDMSESELQRQEDALLDRIMRDEDMQRKRDAASKQEMLDSWGGMVATLEAEAAKQGRPLDPASLLNGIVDLPIEIRQAALVMVKNAVGWSKQQEAIRMGAGEEGDKKMAEWITAHGVELGRIAESQKLTGADALAFLEANSSGLAGRDYFSLLNTFLNTRKAMTSASGADEDDPNAFDTAIEAVEIGDRSTIISLFEAGQITPSTRTRLMSAISSGEFKRRAEADGQYFTTSLQSALQSLEQVLISSESEQFVVMDSSGQMVLNNAGNGLIQGVKNSVVLSWFDWQAANPGASSQDARKFIDEAIEKVVAKTTGAPAEQRQATARKEEITRDVSRMSKEKIPSVITYKDGKFHELKPDGTPGVAVEPQMFASLDEWDRRSTSLLSVMGVPKSDWDMILTKQATAWPNEDKAKLHDRMLEQKFGPEYVAEFKAVRSEAVPLIKQMSALIGSIPAQQMALSERYNPGTTGDRFKSEIDWDGPPQWITKSPGNSWSGYADWQPAAGVINVFGDWAHGKVRDHVPNRAALAILQSTAKAYSGLVDKAAEGDQEALSELSEVREDLEDMLQAPSWSDRNPGPWKKTPHGYWCTPFADPLGVGSDISTN